MGVTMQVIPASEVEAGNAQPNEDKLHKANKEKERNINEQQDNLTMKEAKVKERCEHRMLDIKEQEKIMRR